MAHEPALPFYVRASRIRRTLLLGVATTVSIVLLLWSAPSAGAVTPTTVGLGTADSFNVLASATVTNTGGSMINNGDVGLFPGTAVVGFPPGGITNGVIHATDAQAEQAQADIVTAYNDAAGRLPDETGIIDLGGRTLISGVYSGDALSLTGDLTLDGDASSVFIFQAASSLITASSSRVILTGGASQCNVFWKVGSSATLGTSSTFVGTILALASVSATTGADITGRLFARTGQVSLDDNVINRAGDCAARSAIVASTPSLATLAAIAAQAEADAAAAAAAAALAADGDSLAVGGTDAVMPAMGAMGLIGLGLLLYSVRRDLALARAIVKPPVPRLAPARHRQ